MLFCPDATIPPLDPKGFSMTAMRRLLLLLPALLFSFASWPGLSAEQARDLATLLGQTVAKVLSGDPDVREDALNALLERGDPAAIPGLITVLRFVPEDSAVDAAIAKLAGEASDKDWGEWMLWQQAHPEITPFPGFDRFLADIMALIDPNFREFLYPGIAHDIRLEEIVWGGVKKDGIPALTDPAHIPAAEADYLTPEEPVFGVAINGDARAYPLRIMDWHEMFNDVVGGVPVSLAYCTLCGSGILFETAVEGRDEPFVFGSSGFLYRSNKLMYDQATGSLWNQFTGRPVVGPLTGSGIELALRPVVITSWERWRAEHPETRVLTLDTGYERDYTPGRPYGDYFSSPRLMFPALVEDQRLAAKDQVFAVRVDGLARAWPLAAFEGGRMVNDRIGKLDILLIGDAATRTVRAYLRGEVEAAPGVGPDEVLIGGEVWKVEEDALIGPGGERLERLPGHVAYWFAWQGFIAGGPLALAAE
jgi:hypothetical protein